MRRTGFEGRQRAGASLFVRAILAGPVLAVVMALPAAGQVTGDDPFTLRLPAALSRFSPYADVAGAGGASAASKWSSSANPAALGWLDWPAGRTASLATQYAAVDFDDGPRLHVASQAAVADLGKWGRIQPAVAQVFSDEGTTRQGLGFNFNLQRFQLNWGKKFGDDCAAGAGFQYTRSQSYYDLGSIDVSKSTSDAYAFSAGALHRLCGPLLGGVVAQYSFSQDRTIMYGIPAFAIAETRTADKTHELTLRPGLS